MKGTLPSPSGDTTAVSVGTFIGGAIFGAVTVVLVVGIVCGVFKLRRKCNNRNTKQERFVLLFLLLQVALTTEGMTVSAISKMIRTGTNGLLSGLVIILNCMSFNDDVILIHLPV